MAYIWQHPKSKYFSACYKDDRNVWVKRSTKQTNRTKAMAVAIEMERAAAAGREAVITESQCRKLLSEILERVTGEAFLHRTTSEFLTGWLAGKAKLKSEATAARYAGTVRVFLESLGDRKAKLPLKAITPKDIEKFRNEQQAEGKGASSVGVDLVTLRCAFNLAYRQGLIASNPANAIDLPQGKHHKREGFTADQIKLLLDAADTEWKTAIMLGAKAGCRLGDAATQTWDNVKIEGAMKTLCYVQQKTGKEVKVPLHPDLEAHLLSLAGDDPHAPLTPTLAAMPVSGRNGLSAAFKQIMAKARIDDGRIASTGGKGRAFSTLSFHALRKTFVSDLANAGVAEEIRMELSGHTSRDTHKVYTDLEMNTLAGAIGKLPRIA